MLPYVTRFKIRTQCILLCGLIGFIPVFLLFFAFYNDTDLIAHAFDHGAFVMRVLIVSALLLPMSIGYLLGDALHRIVAGYTDTISTLADGNADFALNAIGTSGELSGMHSAHLKLQQSIRHSQRQELMLNRLSLPVMLTDADFTILYANEASMKVLETVAGHLPVAVDQIVGSNIDIFHKNPMHQRGLLSSLGDHSHRAEFMIGDEWISLNATMLKNHRGECDGAFIDWNIITEQKRIRELNADYNAQIASFGKSLAIIEFDVDGTIRHANENFCNAVGYQPEDIVGKHHRIFMVDGEADTPEYTAFWNDLANGIFQAGEFCRRHKNGDPVWIQASYNPIVDAKGKAYKVVKFATDITKQKLAISKITSMIASANEGKLDERIDVSAFEGFYAEMTHSMNELMDTISDPINNSIHVLTSFSNGDLTQTMLGDYKGSFLQIQDALNGTITRLRDTVMRIRDSAGAVHLASSEISAGSTDLSQRTEQQASSLEETAASMEEITGTVRQNSENAKSANELSSGACNVAERGGQVVNDAVNAMRNIEKSSQKISDIISVIDEIAFQTNLLALNAAVEAARAGEAGKGFAVVASEVRSLAGRSASASKEIKSLIMESSGEVKAGAELVNQAGSTLTEIVDSVKQVATIISDIASASSEQASGINEINSSVSQMDEMTQQNAALVEENTAAAQSLVQQAQALGDMMQFFKIDDHKPQNKVTAHVSDNVVTALHPARDASAPPKITAQKPSNGVLADRKIIAASSNGLATDNEWEEF